MQSYADCPYFRREPGGTCGGGCTTEPTCITMEPAGGWPTFAEMEAEELESDPDTEIILP